MAFRDGWGGHAAQKTSGCGMKALSPARAAQFGFSADKRKRRRQHRRAALWLIRNGGYFNGMSARSSTYGGVARWHLAQARAL